MQRPPIEEIIRVMTNKGYRVFDTPEVDWNLNLVGIRANVLIPNKFDDLLVVFHRFDRIWDARYYTITTDPSPYYLRKPIHPNGTAILCEGQYRSCYKLEIHRRGKTGAHKALCQILGSVRVFRDTDQDGTLDIDPDTIESGMFGINIHRGPRNGQWDENNTAYSAGCQVFSDDRKFDEFLLMCEYGAEAFGNKFTYTLLHERDFNR